MPDEIRLAVRIQHHVSRHIAALLADLTEFRAVAVLTDLTDEGDTWRAHQRCLEAMPATATHLLVLQDDALAQDEVYERTLAAIAEHPAAMVCLFTPGFGYLRKRMWEASNAGDRSFPVPVLAFVPLVATVYPRAMRDSLLRWAGSHHRAQRRIARKGADDGIVAEFCRLHRITPVATVPSIFDHDCSVPSVAKTVRDGPHRRAALL